MHIIIAGCGKVGELLTSYIAGEGHDVVVIDTNPEIIEDTVNEYDVMGIAGNCGMSSVLLEAGAAKADAEGRSRGKALAGVVLRALCAPCPP